jgi:hypothetical protein
MALQFLAHCVSTPSAHPTLIVAGANAMPSAAMFFPSLSEEQVIRIPVHTDDTARETELPSDDPVIDKFIRFVARDSGGRYFLWSMHWGEAGYGCRIANLTPAEERELYKWSAGSNGLCQSRDRRLPDIADQMPVSGSFADSGNALRFFNRKGDPELGRWARIMFNEVQKNGDSDH